MSYLCVECLVEIDEDGTTGHDTRLQMVDTKALETLHAEVFQQFLLSRLLSKHPVVEFEGEISVAEETFKLTFLVAVKEHFLG